MLSYSFFCLLKLNALWIFFGAIAMGNTRRGLSGAVTPAYDILFLFVLKAFHAHSNKIFGEWIIVVFNW